MQTASSACNRCAVHDQAMTRTAPMQSWPDPLLSWLCVESPCNAWQVCLAVVMTCFIASCCRVAVLSQKLNERLYSHRLVGFGNEESMLGVGLVKTCAEVVQMLLPETCLDLCRQLHTQRCVAVLMMLCKVQAAIMSLCLMRDSSGPEALSHKSLANHFSCSDRS